MTEENELLGEAPEIDDPLTMNEIEELQKKILNELYDKAEPPADFDNIRNNPDKQPDDWYQHHYLPSNKQEEIFDKHTEDAPLTNSQRTSLALTCITSLGPTSNKEIAEEKTGREIE